MYSELKHTKRAIQQQLNYIESGINIVPSYSTYNPYIRLLRGCEHREIIVPLFKSICHIITLMNHINRVIEKSTYITTREDVIAGLVIIKQLLEAKKRDELDDINKSEIDRLLSERREQRERLIKEQRLFTAKQLQQTLNKSKGSTHRIIQELLKENKLKIYTGSKNKGYYYQVIK